MKNAKRIFAVIAVIMLVAMYVTTFIASLMNTAFAHQLFLASLYCTILVPIMLYAYMLVYKVVKKKKDKEQE